MMTNRDTEGRSPDLARYDADYIRKFYDEYGEREWERFEANPRSRVNFHVHRWYLEQYVRSGDHALDIGAGPGRFTIELARLGARVTVADVSPGQLALHREKVADAGVERSVVAREVADIVNLSIFPSHSFDVTVCYGGPLSYVFERAGDALRELCRVTKPGGHLLLSVMSVAGTLRFSLPAVLEMTRDHSLQAMIDVIATGNLYGALAGGHQMHLYRWSELEALLKSQGCRVVVASAANFLSVGNEDALSAVLDDATLWQAFLGWEIDFCRQPGALDGGTHMIAVVQVDS